MEDHKLIERAAAAAGIKYDAYASKPKEGRQWWGLWKTFDREPSEYDKRYWNPLRDDGDAFRLAVQLGIAVTPYPIYAQPKHSVIAKQYRNCDTMREANPTEVVEMHGGDAREATRRAIVRCAAALTPNA